MIEPSNGSRTHAPSLHELTAELDGFRRLVDAKFEAMAKLYDERDRRYSERDASRQSEVAKALEASDKQTSSAFAASKEAIGEAKKSQDQYNLSHNDLLRKMERQANEMMMRVQAEDRFKSLDDKIADLRGIVLGTGGQMIGAARASDLWKWAMGALLTVILGIALAVLTVVLRHVAG